MNSLIVTNFANVFPFLTLCSTCVYDAYKTFKPGAHRPARAWFLEIVFVKMSVCVGVCVSAPQAIKNHSCELKPE